MTRQKSPATQPPIGQAIHDNGELWFNLGQRQLPPIAMLGATALMLRNVPPKALAEAIAPALREMVDLADEEPQEEFEEFADEGRPYTFDLWLTNFEFETFGEHQPNV